MRYYEDPCGYPARHHHGRPNIEIDVVPGWGGAYYPPPPPPRPAEVVYMTPAATYVPGTQVMMPQPYGGVTVATNGYYPQQQPGYEYQYQYQYQQPYNNPPYPQW
ncbi:spliceosome-associated protein 49 [Drosophila rhopaloa]|uniref:Spliceosome-associated protein 49 n=1 Tax=Drosophila rhopaloa TaxID=1041015 RepID=A0A6P4FKP5_DRORH|nr:spliceosome-associated protein 49 [Drosophila rhopaloa]